jgi:6-phosphogluconate dehydrogenase
MTNAGSDVGLIGLAVMGSNLALNIAEKGYVVSVYDRELNVTQAFVQNSGSLSNLIVAAEELSAFVSSIKRPRSIILLIKAGAPVDQVIGALLPFLDKGDTIIDGGNTEFKDTVRRSQSLQKKGVHFVGLGVSGGEEGARHGPSLMFGGSRTSWDAISPLLNDIAVKFEGTPCCAYLGEDGAGNFVKTIHNGIEYADMQMIAEIYGIMRDGFSMSAGEIGDVFEDWNNGALNSYLIEITAKALRTIDPETGDPLVDIILDSAGQKGTGRWAVMEAQNLGVSATTLEAAVSARSLSSSRDVRIEASEALALDVVEARNQLSQSTTLQDLEQALLVGKIAAYAQGFSVLDAASQAYGWEIPLGDVAKVWRAGCIIRSSFLNEIANIYDEQTGLSSLLLAPYFSDAVMDGQGALRQTVAQAVLSGLPVPALNSAVSYIDGISQARSTANLIQAQRDFFGAHSFKRLDKDGDHHGCWSK